VQHKESVRALIDVACPLRRVLTTALLNSYLNAENKVMSPDLHYFPTRTGLAAAWARCRGFLLPALDECRGTYTEDEIVGGLLSGRYLLFEGPDAAAVTYIDKFPTMTVFHMFLAGGNLTTLQAMEQNVAAQAKAAGIARMEISGRRGWLRTLPGYSELCTTVFKDL
jgi:hypothetical protein